MPPITFDENKSTDIAMIYAYLYAYFKISIEIAEMSIEIVKISMRVAKISVRLRRIL